jgi:hypothetical protein
MEFFLYPSLMQGAFEYVSLSVFFTSEISPEGNFFLPLVYFWRNLDPKKILLSPKIYLFWPFFIHLNPFSSTFRAFIQHPDELASGYVLVVPPGRKTKNHRKYTGFTHPLLVRFGIHVPNMMCIEMVQKLKYFAPKVVKVYCPYRTQDINLFTQML